MVTMEGLVRAMGKLMKAMGTERSFKITTPGEVYLAQIISKGKEVYNLEYYYLGFSLGVSL